MRNYFLTFLFFSLLAFTSCKKHIQFSLLESRPNEKNLNYVNIGKIQQLAVQDSFDFIVISDTQVAYDQLERFVKHINRLPGNRLSFVIHGGDFTDYGANFEFNAYEEVIRDLELPVVGVIGNHDMLGNGTAIYRKMFGQEDFTFTYGKNTFVFQNTNSREAAFDGNTPDIGWLNQQVERIPTDHNVFYVGHVPPFSLDFDEKLESDYTHVQASIPNPKIAIYGHHHTYELSQPYDNDLRYIVAPTILKREYVWVSVKGDDIDVQLKTF